MLEFSSLIDAHFHLLDCSKNEDVFKMLNALHWDKGIACCHSKEEFLETERLRDSCNIPGGKIFLSFGIHPWWPDKALISFLEELLVHKRIDCVGEAGFDFYSPELRKAELLQEEVWASQLELCIKYNKPLVIHERKALEKIFRYEEKLSKIPSILFHSFSGSNIEAESLLKKLPQSYFSLGKQLLNGSKKALSCIKKLPLENLLLETDAPFQVLKGESFTSVGAIKKVYSKAFEQRPELTAGQLEKNFSSFLNLR